MARKIRKGIAIVIDSSGSFAPFFDAFFSSTEVEKIVKPKIYGASPAKNINALLKDYSQVVFITDGELYGKLSKQIQVVEVKTP